jgi:hypothetical protein
MWRRTAPIRPFFPRPSGRGHSWGQRQYAGKKASVRASGGVGTSFKVAASFEGRVIRRQEGGGQASKLLLSVAAVAAVVLTACGSSTGSSTARAPATIRSCSPAPCAIKDGVIVTVSNVKPNFPPSQFSQLQAGNHYVSLMVGFTNTADKEYNPTPFMFALKDPTGVKRDASATLENLSCSNWTQSGPERPLYKGATVQPRQLCFQAGGDPNGPLTLVWTPTATSGDVNIPLQ